ncbi:MAG: peroxiredoxin family protein [Acidobacteriota bacterium]
MRISSGAGTFTVDLGEIEQAEWRDCLLVFFKTTCPTCQLTWPYLERTYQAYRGAGLAVWGISQDGQAASTQFASDYHGTFPILIDADLRVSRGFNPQFVPTLFLIDPEGKIVERIIAFDKARLNQLSETVAARLDAPARVIALADDGNPPFKPG